MSASKKIILLGCDPSDDPDEGYGMEFRLTYDGPIYARQRSMPPQHVENQHNIRKTFHVQLKNFWATMPDRAAKADQFVYVAAVPGQAAPATDAEVLAKKHVLYGFNFVPLVTEELDLLCSLDILFLRPDKPGGIFPWAGDIDNRLKTLLDALRIPEAGENYAGRIAQDDEKPFYCLLEDDKLITKVTVETDRLLQPVGQRLAAADARLVITVRLRPSEITPHNMHFG